MRSFLVVVLVVSALGCEAPEGDPGAQGWGPFDPSTHDAGADGPPGDGAAAPDGAPAGDREPGPPPGLGGDAPEPPPQPTQQPRPWTGPGPVFEVAPDCEAGEPPPGPSGEARFCDLSAALDAAAEVDRAVVRLPPGLHRIDRALERSVALVAGVEAEGLTPSRLDGCDAPAVGVPAETVVDLDAPNGLRVALTDPAGAVIVAGVRVHGTVRVERGHLDVRGGELAGGLLVSGAESSAAVVGAVVGPCVGCDSPPDGPPREPHLHEYAVNHGDCADTTLRVRDGARLLGKDLHLPTSPGTDGGSGACVSNAELILCGGEITDPEPGFGVGVLVLADGRLSAEGTTIREAAKAGVLVDGDGLVRLVGVTIEDTRRDLGHTLGAAVIAQNGGVARIDGLTASSDQASGLWVTNGGFVEAERAILNGNTGAAAAVFGGVLRLRDTSLSQTLPESTNKNAVGVVANHTPAGPSELRLQNCTVDGNLVGVYVEGDGGQVTVEDSALTGSLQAAVLPNVMAYGHGALLFRACGGTTFAGNTWTGNAGTQLLADASDVTLGPGSWSANGAVDVRQQECAARACVVPLTVADTAAAGLGPGHVVDLCPQTSEVSRPVELKLRVDLGGSLDP